MAETTADRLNNFIDETGCPAVAVAALCKISQPVLSNYRTGVLQPSSGDAKKIDETVSRLRMLIATLRPIPIDFRRVGEIQTLLDKVEAGTMMCFIIDDLPVRCRKWVVKLGNGKYFAGLADGVPTSSLNEGEKFNVPVMSEEVADQVVAALADRGVTATKVPANVLNDDTPVHESFSGVWS